MSPDRKTEKIAHAPASETDPQGEWHRVAHTLSEALPFMRRYAGKTVVIKYGGNAMVDDAIADNFARDVALIKQVGINPVVVHGGGPQIGDMLEKLGIESEFINGLRVTDAKTVEVVETVLTGAINKDIVSRISKAGGNAVGMSGKHGRLIEARKLMRTIRDPQSNIEKVLDLGFVGEPVQINTQVLDEMINLDVIPVVAPVGIGKDDETYNINADTAAGAIASALKATRFYLLTDVAGVLDENRDLITEMGTREAQELIASGTVNGGMIPKVSTCIEAVKEHVGAAVIMDGRVTHALLLEMFTEHGAGTLIGTK
ncbi:MAG TPA: acetylglutamate kinase [Sneathiellales bacterium]|nr:acetylglutamate kinase [Sneathiellales bacterium]